MLPSMVIGNMGYLGRYEAVGGKLFTRLMLLSSRPFALSLQ